MTIEERIQKGKARDRSIIHELVWNRDFFVRYIELPYSIGGASTMNDDGTFNIYINSRHYADRQWKSLWHEVIHCECGHLDYWKDLPEEVKEWEADHLTDLRKVLWSAS